MIQRNVIEYSIAFMKHCQLLITNTFFIDEKETYILTLTVLFVLLG